MGHFSFTCAISSLPINGGTAVRCILLTQSPYEKYGMSSEWFPRTFPIRAKYNDYGSIEDIADGVGKDLWLHGLKYDLVSVGVGENTCHDVMTCKDMSFEDMLLAIVEGRLLVRREMHGLNQAIFELPEYSMKMKVPVPVGVPTIKRVRKILECNGYKVRGEYCTGGYVIDKRGYGEIRIRWEGIGDEYGKDIEKLEELRGILEREYIISIIAGRGLNVVDLMVQVKPGTKGYHGRAKYSRKPLQVSMMMVREDIWQEILKKDIRTWGKKVSLKEEKEQMYEYYKRCFTSLQKIMTDNNPIHFMEMMDIDNNGVACYLYRSEMPFTMGLNEHLLLLLKMGKGLEEVKGYLDEIAEFVHIWRYMQGLRWNWRPSNESGPQDPEWEKELEFRKMAMKICQKEYKSYS